MRSLSSEGLSASASPVDTHANDWCVIRRLNTYSSWFGIVGRSVGDESVGNITVRSVLLVGEPCRQWDAVPHGRHYRCCGRLVGRLSRCSSAKMFLPR